ncbi:uncharacterized protein LOC119076649 isoform X4 [Bradysia coprophila]|uniref:uncharacterized protein LOC119076649 isoform X4 n=1 Tax=Bradysia coprophila TaxID=38358 RepID=UPI00187DAE60|nr:uncharacterized protein LOC119076649 isoform X4 [Bradysia coprophila]
MTEENIRDELRKIANVMDSVSLETVKIAKIQADMCEVKKENTGLKEKVSSLELRVTSLKEENATLRSEVNTLIGEVKTLSGENAVLRGLNRTVLDKATKLDEENIVLKNNVDTLRSDFDVLKSTFMAKVGQCSNEQESDLAGGEKEELAVGEGVTGGGEELAGGEEEPVDTEVNLDDGNIGREQQKKREQIETFRNWKNVMKQRKKPEEFWASGLVKYTMEEWEDAEKMDGEQILDFINTNVDELTAFISSEKSKERFFLTFIKLCSMRDVSKSKFQEIMQCFEEIVIAGGSSQNHRITEPEVRKFTELYKGLLESK